MSRLPTVPDPPRLAVWLAGFRLSPEQREFQVGDLVEEFRQVVVGAQGERSARRWFWRQAVRCALSRQVPDRRSVETGRSPGRWSTGLGRDLRFAWQITGRSRLVSAAVVVTFALGIGANVAMFTVAWPVLVAPLPVPDEEELARVWLTYRTDQGMHNNPVSPADYLDMRAASSFRHLAAFGRHLAEVNLTTGGPPEQITLGSVGDNFFTTVGVQPVLGRPLLPSDLKSDANQDAIVLSEGLWRRHFGSSPEILGRSVRLDGQPHQVIGVMPDAAGLGTRPAAAWRLMDLSGERRFVRRAYYLGVVGRLRDGVTLDEANAELRVLMARVAEAHPESNDGLSARAYPLREELTGPARPTLLLLIGGGLLVLLVAGVNLAGLQRARLSGRRRELAVRCALGASRSQIARQLLAEGLVVAALGGVVGVFCAFWTLSLLRRLAPPDFWVDLGAASQATVLVYAAGLTAAAGLAVSLLPAWRGAATPLEFVQSARAGTGERGAAWSRGLLVSTQVALTAMLLIAATLTAVSLVRVLRVDPGFETAGLVVANFSLPQDGYPTTESRISFYNRLLERLEALPGVRGACVANDVPLDNEHGSMTWVVPGETRMVSSIPKVASPGCFDTLGIPLLRGRLFGSEPGNAELLLSESMAAQLWPDGTDPLERELEMGLPGGRRMRIVGVVGDIRNGSLEWDFGRQVWLSYSSGFWHPKRLVAGVGNEPEAIVPALRQLMGEIDRELALADVRTMDGIISQATASRRFVLVLLAGFAVIALVLSAVGIYGVVSYTVGQRTWEIGIRLALGAESGDVLRLVAGYVSAAVLVGAAAGVGGALAMSSLLGSLLYETSATDARIVGPVIAVIAVIAVLAAGPPTLRALKTDPATVLQPEGR